jgi:hypothetical protein
MRRSTKLFGFFLLVAVAAVSRGAQAANLTVNCDNKQTISKTLRLLAATNPQGPNTITVWGSCRETIVIRGMERLTLITKKGASITGRSNGAPVVDIENSQSVTLQGFTINGGVAQGILCNTASVCFLTGNTIQGPGTFGVNVVRGSRAFLESNVIQNWARGAFITGAQVFSSNDIFQNNGGSAIAVLTAAYFESVNSNFLNNGDGIEAGGTVTLVGGLITGNSGIGVRLLSGKVVFQGPTITGNGGVGVHLEDGAFAGFLAANITGNLGDLDIECAPQFPITRFIDRTGGITNCVEPPSNSKLKDAE